MVSNNNNDEENKAIGGNEMTVTNDEELKINRKSSSSLPFSPSFSPLTSPSLSRSSSSSSSSFSSNDYFKSILNKKNISEDFFEVTNQGFQTLRYVKSLVRKSVALANRRSNSKNGGKGKEKGEGKKEEEKVNGKEEEKEKKLLLGKDLANDGRRNNENISDVNNNNDNEYVRAYEDILDRIKLAQDRTEQLLSYFENRISLKIKKDSKWLEKYEAEVNFSSFSTAVSSISPFSSTSSFSAAAADVSSSSSMISPFPNDPLLLLSPSPSHITNSNTDTQSPQFPSPSSFSSSSLQSAPSASSSSPPSPPPSLTLPSSPPSPPPPPSHPYITHLLHFASVANDTPLYKAMIEAYSAVCGVPDDYSLIPHFKIMANAVNMGLVRRRGKRGEEGDKREEKKEGKGEEERQQGEREMGGGKEKRKRGKENVKRSGGCVEGKEEDNADEFTLCMFIDVLENEVCK